MQFERYIFNFKNKHVKEYRIYNLYELMLELHQIHFNC